MKLSDIPPGPFRDKIEAALAAEDRRHAPPPPAADHAEADAATGPEAKLQADCEAWLAWRGYWHRSEADIAAGPPPRGWQFHLHAARQNHILLDLLLLSNDGRWLEIELKTKRGRLAKHQAALVAQDPARRCVCRSVEALAARVEAWEAEARPGTRISMAEAVVRADATLAAAEARRDAIAKREATGGY